MPDARENPIRRQRSQCCQKNKITYKKNNEECDLLNGLMNITVDDKNKNSSDAEKIVESACLKSQQTCQNQKPNVFVVRKTVRVVTAQAIKVENEAQV